MTRKLAVLLSAAVAFGASTAFVAHAVQAPDRGEGKVSGSASVRGVLAAENHRSATVLVVESLLYIAGKEDGGALGDTVRAIAQSQKEALPRAAEAIEEASSRGALETFFWGSDCENLAVLESEIVATEADLAELEAALAGTTNATDRAILSSQIKTLTEIRARMENFVTAHARTPGLFGRRADS